MIWIGFYLWLLWGNKYHFFIQAKFKFLLVTAMVILVLFIIALIGNSIHPPPGSLTIDKWLKGIFLCLPVFLIFQVDDLTLGAYAFKKRGANTRLTATSQNNLSALKPNDSSANTERLSNPIPTRDSTNVITGDKKVSEIMPASLRELVYMPESYIDRQVVTSGMFFNDAKQTPSGCFVLFRFVVSCCVADAQPLGVLIKTMDIQGFDNDQWLEVKGTFHTTTIDGYDAFYIIPLEIRETDKPPPEKQYLSSFN